jgi:hypothetical protein
MTGKGPKTFFNSLFSLDTGSGVTFLPGHT